MTPTEMYVPPQVTARALMGWGTLASPYVRIVIRDSANTILYTSGAIKILSSMAYSKLRIYTAGPVTLANVSLPAGTCYFYTYPGSYTTHIDLPDDYLCRMTVSVAAAVSSAVLLLEFPDNLLLEI